MPSPVGHALGGLIVALALAPNPPLQIESGGNVGDRRVPGGGDLSAAARRALRLPPRSGAFVAWCVVAACVPDIDFAWGRHNMETHSIGFAAIVGLLVFAWTRSPRLALASGLAVGTHVLFDWLGADDSPPIGVMALWPLSTAFYFADAFLFAAISRRYWLPGFAAHNLWAVARELVLLLPLVAAATLCRRPGHSAPWWRSGAS